MYHCKSEEFGGFVKYSFYNEQTQNCFSITPEQGACLLDVTMSGQAIIDGYQTAEDLLKNNWFKSNFLFPFPNRLKKGIYKHNAKSYQFPLNDAGTDNNVHGFGVHQPFEIISSDCLNTRTELLCRHTNQGKDPAYPFAFSINVKLSISDPNDFEIEMTFKNESQQEIPVGLGWHPYFNCFDQLDNVILQLPDCQFIEVDEQALPSGQRFDYEYFKSKRKFGRVELDNAFEITDQKGRAEIRLFSEKGQLTVWQETGPGKFNFMQIFTPPDRRSIAIEPMTCNINAFNNGEGLVILEPGAQISGRFGFSYLLT